MIFRVFGDERDGFLLGVVIYALERGFVVDDHCGNIAVIDHVALLEEHDIAVAYAGVYHAVAFGDKAEIGVDIRA